MQMDNSKASFLPYETTDINESSMLANQKEINESPETRDRCLEILRQELKNIKDIDPCLDESFLLMFLRVSKFNTQKALQRLQRYYQQCDVLLDAFKKCSLPLHRAQSFNHLFISPYRMKNNSLLLIAKTKAVDYRKCTFAERFYLEVLTMYGVLENPVNQLCGSTFIFDYEGFDIHGFLAYTPGWIQIFLSFLLNAAPCRLKAVHIINAPTIFSAVFNIGYPFLHKKIRERVFIHSRNDGWRNLHASIPADILPKQYGGKISDEQLINCLGEVEEMEDKFLKSFTFGSIKNQHKRKSMKLIC